MSAIYGLLYRDGRVVGSRRLERMRESLAHRGPDGGGSWHRDSIGLGQCILHTTPESRAEGGPATANDEGPVIVADARIDNRDDLMRMLGMQVRNGIVTDSEIILAAWRKWERACPEKLVGDFAFAIWDPKRQAVFCARDPMGVRPLYYYLSDHLFAFASELKGLFALQEIPRELDEVQVAYFLDWFRSDNQRTFFRNLRRLPASQWMEVDASRSAFGTHWKADGSREVRFTRDEEYAEAFRDLFVEAVRCRLRSEVPVGSALSGGLDSSSIACTAAMLLGGERPFHTVSATFPGLPDEYRERNDESPFIDAVARTPGIVSHRVLADRIGVFDYLDRMFWHHDVPPFGFLYWMRWAVYEEAHRQGVRVFLSGDDGDTVVDYGYGLFNDLALAGEWKVALDALEALNRRYETASERTWPAYLRPQLVALAKTRRWKSWRIGCDIVGRRFGISPHGLMGRTAFDAYLGNWLRDKSRELRGKTQDPSLVKPEFARRVNLEERKRAIATWRWDPIPPTRESHARVLPSGMLQHIMEVTDAMGSAFSIETRCPFLDRRLIEFSVAIPSDQKLLDGWTRSVLRRAMEGILPPEVQWRLQKADLAYNMVSHLLEDDHHALVDAIFQAPEVLEDYVDMDELRKLQHRFDTNRLRGGRRNAARLYIAAVLAMWLRRFHTEAETPTAGNPA